MLLAAVAAVAAAGTTAGLTLTRGQPGGGPRAARLTASSAAGQPQAPATAGSRRPSAGGTPPAAPAHVLATAINQRTIRVSWTDTASGVTSFAISNGCGTDGCNGGAVNVRTGPVTAADITTTPGAYQCFYVQAVNSAGTSEPASPGCTSTPPMNIPSSQEWTDTGVTARAGAAVGISATGDVYLAAARSSHPPGGDSSCTPATDFAARGSLFPAPQLPCWSLIARFGNGPPFEVGNSIVVIATGGRLYLGVNTGSFSGNAGIWTVKIKIGGSA